jgi:hypothetical protein
MGRVGGAAAEPCRGALQLLTACGFRSADGVLTMADDAVDVGKLEYALGRLGGVEAEKAAAVGSAAKAAEEARLALFKQQQEDRRGELTINLPLLVIFWVSFWQIACKMHEQSAISCGVWLH